MQNDSDVEVDQVSQSEHSSPKASCDSETVVTSQEDDVTDRQGALPTDEDAQTACSEVKVEAEQIEQLLQEMSLKVDEALSSSHFSRAPTARTSVSATAVMRTERVTSSESQPSDRGRAVRCASLENVSPKHVDV